MHRDIEEYILNCDACARWKSGRTQVAPMSSLPEANEPGDIAYIVITGPYATTPRGNRYLLTYVDHFTKWAEAVPLPDQEARTVAHARSLRATECEPGSLVTEGGTSPPN
jgi:hypothetical protein